MAKASHEGIEWPDGRAFAFTIVDDTDGAYVDKVKPVYDFLKKLGLRTTKTVWTVATPGAPRWHGDTCETPAYLDWIKQLQADGFEIAHHGASSDSSTRDKTVESFKRFREMFGHDPVTHANHYSNLDSIYWGDARTTGLARLAYLLMSRFKTRGKSLGHVKDSPHFWGDICREKISYVRNFVYADINTLKKCPLMPYSDPARPYVNAWYSASEAANADSFCRLLSSKNQQRLEQERGACFVYTHFARGFASDGVLRPEFCQLMEELAKRNGWFVPADTLLRFLEQRHGGVHVLSASERRKLEWSWLRDKVLLGNT